MAKKIKKKISNKPRKSRLVIPQGKKIVLHIGCEKDQRGQDLDSRFSGNDWHEVRLAFSSNVKNVDLVADIRKLTGVADNQFDAIWVPHKIDRFADHELNQIFKELLRVLKPNGQLLMSAPNLKSVAETIYKKGIDAVLYQVEKYKITPIDMLFGFRDALKKGKTNILHKSGFTAAYLGIILRDAGLLDVKVQSNGYQLWAVAYKRLQKTESNGFVKIINEDVNEKMRKRDEIDLPPTRAVDY